MKINLIFTIFLCKAYGFDEGSDTITHDQAPSIASIQVRGQHLCGGTVLSQQYVLTTAQCMLLFEVTDYSVQIGSATLYRGGATVKVSKIYKHPKFKNTKIDYDFALLYLESIPKYPSNVAFAKLPDHPTDELKAGEKAYLIGWGKSLDITENTDLLRRAIVPIVDFRTCNRNYGRSRITLRMVCAGYAGSGLDNCEGTGGALLMRVSDSLQVGLSSWGAGCTIPNVPGVYSRIVVVRDWIKSIAGV